MAIKKTKANTSEPSRDKKRELAQQLYLHTNLDQKQICEKVGWTETTFTRNKQKYDWDKLKAAHSVTRENIISSLYQQINSITEAATKESRTLDSKETDKIVKLSNSIDTLSKRESLSTYIQVFETFSKFLLKANGKLAKELIEYQDQFINIKVNELT